MAKTWHEDDEFWVTMAPKMFGEGRWATTSEDAERVTSLLGVSPEAEMLDMCCGPGRHSLELARRGFRVTGVDRTAIYLEMARQKAEREGLSIEFVQDDMRYFCRPDSFDAAIMMYTSFGYFENPEENQRVLVNIYRSLKQDGSLLIEMMGKEVLARIFRERDWYEEEGVLYLEERKISRNWSRIENRWILLRGQERHEFEFSIWIYSAAELTALLHESGFEAVEIYGDLTGAPYDHTARRLVAVARRVQRP